MRGRPGGAAVEAAARIIFDRAWLADGSLFAEGGHVWTPEVVEELHEQYVLKPEAEGPDFMSKLKLELGPVSDDARQLFAELLYLNLLPLADYFGSKKREIIGTVLGWTQAPPVIPSELDAALEQGIFNGGVAFKTRRWNQLTLLIELVRQFKALALDERRRLLGDPWAFRDFVRGADGPKEPAQRNSVLYLAFPDVFLPIVNSDHRKRILKAFHEYLEAPTGDIDRDLYAVQQALDSENNDHVDFYRSPWRERWRTPAEPEIPEAEPEPAANVRRAWLVRGSSVRGRNLVPLWLAEKFVSLQASRLPSIDSDVDKDALRALVDEHYSDVSYNQRQQKFEEMYAFLSRMATGDVVATTSQGRMYVGRITGDASYVPGTEGLSNLRRTVSWAGPQGGVDYADLPPALTARLQAQHDVIDLTQHLADLEALLREGRPEQRQPSQPVVLPDATNSLAEQLLVTREWLQECIDLLRDRPQLIFYGPPGTGKTYLAQHLAHHLAGRENTALVQFHPAYSYEDFFEGFRPSAGEGGTVSFQLQPGPFRRIVDQAREHPESAFVLIIDEINRGNLAKIFGELYFLLEYRDQAIELLYSSGAEQAFTLPPNVLIIGTMNTADRSIALVDAAMRRRFSFVALHPSEEPTRSMLGRWLSREDISSDAAALLERLNQEIADPDFKIGPSYLMRRPVYVEGGIERVWRTSILPLLEEHHYGESVDVSARYGLTRLRTALARTGQTDEPVTPEVAEGAAPGTEAAS